MEDKMKYEELEKRIEKLERDRDAMLEWGRQFDVPKGKTMIEGTLRDTLQKCPICKMDFHSVRCPHSLSEALKAFSKGDKE
jgi:hypothetical protein